MLTPLKSLWEEGKKFETEFWGTWINSNGGQWTDDFNNRMNPDHPLDTHVASFLLQVNGTPKVLDVGAGPVTCLGKVLPDGRKINITALDPLAHDYEDLFAGKGITPPVKTTFGEVEKLDEQFPANRFDLVHMRNALDHSYNPLLGIKQMVYVVKKGGVVILEHSTNEAVKANYGAFHQWNICVENSELILWNKQEKCNVNFELRGTGKVIAWGNDDWTSVVIEKL